MANAEERTSRAGPLLIPFPMLSMMLRSGPMDARRSSIVDNSAEKGGPIVHKLSRAPDAESVPITVPAAEHIAPPSAGLRLRSVLSMRETFLRRSPGRDTAPVQKSERTSSQRTLHSAPRTPYQVDWQQAAGRKRSPLARRLSYGIL
jgi:hypothetical protein